MTPLEYQRQVAVIGSRTSALLLRLWRRVDRSAIAASWQRLLPEAVAVVTAGQLAAASLADPYLDSRVGSDGAALVVPASLAGRTLDGRTLEGLLTLPQISALTEIGRGLTPAMALRRAGGQLALYGRTATADSARQAVAAGMGARRVAGYRRQLSLPSCARCVILAGRWYRSSVAFARHPGCDCTHAPASDPGAGPEVDPRQAILSGQVTGLSEAEVEAIRLGASPSSVVNARRGMSTVGGRQVTAEGTTVRGMYGGYVRDPDGTWRRRSDAELAKRGGRYRRTTDLRPTPEQIMADATSADDAIRRLRTYAYIV